MEKVELSYMYGSRLLHFSFHIEFITVQKVSRHKYIITVIKFNIK